jgi:hypothetical protein
MKRYTVGCKVLADRHYIILRSRIVTPKALEILSYHKGTLAMILIIENKYDKPSKLKSSNS